MKYIIFLKSAVAVSCCNVLSLLLCVLRLSTGVVSSNGNMPKITKLNLNLLIKFVPDFNEKNYFITSFIILYYFIYESHKSAPS